MRPLRNLCCLFATALTLLPSAAHAGAKAEIQALQYPAWVEREGKRDPLLPGAQINSGETVVSGRYARVMLGLPDGSSIKLGAESRFVLDKLASQTAAGATSLDARLTLLKGFFRYSTGTLAKLTGKRAVELKIATATIGVRGTDYWAMTDEEHDAVCLFEGKVDVATRDQGLIPLEQPTAFWARFFDKPAQPAGNATGAELKRFVESVELTSGNGVAVPNGRWRVVAGAVPTQAEAQALSAKLRNEGYPASTIKSYGLHEVRIPQLATRADAEHLLQRLGKQGLLGSEAKVVASR